MQPHHLDITSAVFHSNVFYVIKTDLEGCYTYVNDLFNKDFKHLSDNFIGQHVHNSVHQDDQTECVRAVTACCTSPNQSAVAIIRKPRPDGSFVYTEWEFTALTNANDQPVEILCIGYNVSKNMIEQKKLEHAIHATNDSLEKLQYSNASLMRANKHLDRLLYIISHDLRSPINSALGLIEIMQKQESIAAIYNLLNAQEHTLQKLDAFVLDIIDYSKNSRRPVISSSIDWEAMIQVAINLHQADEYLEVRTDVQQDVEFFSDKMRIAILLNNLIGNAVKFRSHQQRSPFIYVSVYAKAERAELTIQDNGIGIKEAHQSQVFDLFFRGDEQVPGSGFGLHIVKEIMEKLHGQIHIDSTPGVGTKFTINLPNLISPEEALF